MSLKPDKLRLIELSNYTAQIGTFEYKRPQLISVSVGAEHTVAHWLLSPFLDRHIIDNTPQFDTISSSSFPRRIYVGGKYAALKQVCNLEN